MLIFKIEIFLTVSLPADILWGSFGEMNGWQTNPKGRLRGGYLTVCVAVIAIEIWASIVTFYF